MIVGNRIVVDDSHATRAGRRGVVTNTTPGTKETLVHVRLDGEKAICCFRRSELSAVAK